MSSHNKSNSSLTSVRQWAFDDRRKGTAADQEPVTPSGMNVACNLLFFQTLRQMQALRKQFMLQHAKEEEASEPGSPTNAHTSHFACKSQHAPQQGQLSTHVGTQ